jgi:hypothetical protein
VERVPGPSRNFTATAAVSALRCGSEEWRRTIAVTWARPGRVSATHRQFVPYGSRGEKHQVPALLHWSQQSLHVN